ncbi:MAG TPA: RNA polymerase sigma factor [Thiolapillus brandeum]|uniref:RNA polymerase sigma factor n=1 Tax=Thiolapillus brandeum TaxID=1076588 RepID=A0A831K222_9GAMM|nr:RNA polymerase sigma factor [Thiolapillus brandeum]
MGFAFCKKIDKQAAQNRLVVYLDRLYGYACSLTKDREYAQDLVQITAVKALTAKKIPVDESAYRAWLFTIMRNTFRDELRRNGDNTVSLEQIEEKSDLWNKIDDSYVSTNSERAIITKLSVHSSLEKLSHDHREIIMLVDVLGFSYRECADILDVPGGTIMSRISRARKSLLGIMSQGQSKSVVSSMEF